MLKRNLGHVKRDWDGGIARGVSSGEVTPPLSESESTRRSRSGSEGGVYQEDLAGMKISGNTLGEKLQNVEQEVPEQVAQLPLPGEENVAPDSLEEALNGVQLD